MALAVNVYPLSRYIIGHKDPIIWKDPSNIARYSRMRNRYREEGMMESVGAILLVHVHNFPSILLLQRGLKFYKLPGGRLRPGENAIEGLRRKLTSQIGPTHPFRVPDWQIGECVATWWRPNFNDNMRPVPSCVFNSEPKERTRLFLVHLPARSVFLQKPSNLSLVALPLYALDQLPQSFGRVISSIPQNLSRFQLNTINP